MQVKTTNLLLCGGNHHHHLASLEFWLGFNLGNIRQIFANLFQELHTKLHMRHFTTTKTQGHLYLVTFTEELVHRPHLHIIIMRIDVGTHLDFLDSLRLLLFACFCCLFLGLKLVLAKIQYFADGGIVVRRNLHKIETLFQGQFSCSFYGNCPVILAFGVYQLYFRYRNIIIGTWAAFLGRLRPVWSANGFILLFYCICAESDELSICIARIKLKIINKSLFDVIGSIAVKMCVNQGSKAQPMPSFADPEYIEVGKGVNARKIAVRKLAGNAPGLVWLGGYRSDMLGTKAEALENWARQNGHSCCRHDYSGHGESDGKFVDGTISRWLEESLAVFDQKCSEGNHLMVGSSMGGWVALRMVQELAKRKESHRVKALLLLAPAPDFTHELMLPELSDTHREQLETQGYMEEPSEYSDEPNVFTKALFDDGEKNRVMTGLIETGCPVHILQGMQDPDVPYTHALKLVEFLPQEEVSMTLVKDGDHRLSRDQDIALLLRTVETLVG